MRPPTGGTLFVSAEAIGGDFVRHVLAALALVWVLAVAGSSVGAQQGAPGPRPPETLPLAPVTTGSPRTFNEDVAPILFKHCTGCHRPGTVAPMSLLTYTDARPWAKSIRDKIVDREMPPGMRTRRSAASPMPGR